MDEDISKNLKIAMAQLEKQFGKNTVVKLGEQEFAAIEAISTGSPTVDYALGIGGVPKGRIIEIFGGESAGKSSLALSMVSQAQKQGLVCLYVDAEHAMDLHYARTLGVNVDELLFAQPTTGEEAMTIVDHMTSTGAVGLIIVDSVAALTPKAEMEGEIGQSHVGLLPRLMAQSLRKITANLNQTNTTIVFINQIREKIGVMYGSPETQPGGRALKFYSSVRIELRKKEILKDTSGEVTGVKTKIKVIKNKVGPPLREAEFDIYYGKGIDQVGGLVDLAIEKKVVKMAGGGYIKFKDENLCQGKNQFKQLLLDDEDLHKEIHELVFNPPEPKEEENELQQV